MELCSTGIADNPVTVSDGSNLPITPGTPEVAAWSVAVELPPIGSDRVAPSGGEFEVLDALRSHILALPDLAKFAVIIAAIVGVPRLAAWVRVPPMVGL